MQDKFQTNIKGKASRESEMIQCIYIYFILLHIFLFVSIFFYMYSKYILAPGDTWHFLLKVLIIYNKKS